MECENLMVVFLVLWSLWLYKLMCWVTNRMFDYMSIFDNLLFCNTMIDKTPKLPSVTKDKYIPKTCFKKLFKESSI